MANVIEVCLFFMGVYYLYNLFKMKATNTIPPAFVNKKINLERSHDIPGYVKYIFPRGLVFGIGLCVFSGVIILSSYIYINVYIKLICEIAYIALIVYFAVVSVKATNKYLF